MAALQADLQLTRESAAEQATAVARHAAALDSARTLRRTDTIGAHTCFLDFAEALASLHERAVAAERMPSPPPRPPPSQLLARGTFGGAAAASAAAAAAVAAEAAVKPKGWMGAAQRAWKALERLEESEERAALRRHDAAILSRELRASEAEVDACRAALATCERRTSEAASRSTLELAREREAMAAEVDAMRTTHAFALAQADVREHCLARSVGDADAEVTKLRAAADALAAENRAQLVESLGLVQVSSLDRTHAPPTAPPSG